MCLSPHRLPDNTLVACKGCDICRQNRVNDLIGRCVAESCTASSTVAVTLTYAGDVPEAATLSYRGVQLMFKRLRKAGFTFRYIIAGEYGTEKERAHWHAVLFFYGKTPDIEKDRRVNWSFWPHGFSYFQAPDYGGFRYILKYALKNQTARGAEKALYMSKLPPLGYQFFMDRARDLAAKRLPLIDPKYSFRNIRKQDGSLRQFWLQGRMRELYIEEYISEWARLYDDQPRFSDWVTENYLDKIARKEMEAEGNFIREILARPRCDFDPVKAAAWDKADSGTEPRAIAYCLIPGDNPGIATVYDDGTATVFDGESEWLVDQASALVGPLLRNTKLKPSVATQVCRWLQNQFAVLGPSPALPSPRGTST